MKLDQIGNVCLDSSQEAELRPPTPRLDHDEIEAELYRLLGHFFVAFARVELNLSLRVGAEGAFHDKLERFLDSSVKLSESDDMFCRFSAWYMAANSIRDMRNRFAHGRWGILVHSQRVAHVDGYPPGVQEERRFSLGELYAIVQDVESINDELAKLPS